MRGDKKMRRREGDRRRGDEWRGRKGEEKSKRRDQQVVSLYSYRSNLPAQANLEPSFGACLCSVSLARIRVVAAELWQLPDR